MKPMMKCGHAANSNHVLPDGTRKPSCVICYGIHPGAGEIDEAPPTFVGRLAYCCYKGSPCKTHRYGKGQSQPDFGEFDAQGRAFAPSSPDLPFFEHKPTQPHDEYYCGCFGWD